MLDDLHIGAPVHGSGAKKLGTLKRIVVEQSDHRVTHLVVDPGLIESGNLFAPGGWEKPRERLVPVSLVTATSDSGVTLSSDEAAFLALPLFESETYVEAPAESGRFNLGELVSYIATGAGVGAAPYVPSNEERVFNEAPGSVEIAEGTPVWRRIPHEEIGEVERVLVDDATDTVQSLVVRRRGLARHMVILPMGAVADLTDGVVHVTLSDDELSALPRYTPPDE